MSSGKKHIDDFLRDKLGADQPTSQDTGWNDFANVYSKHKEKKRKRRFLIIFFFVFASAAALITLKFATDNSNSISDTKITHNNNDSNSSGNSGNSNNTNNKSTNLNRNSPASQNEAFKDGNSINKVESNESNISSTEKYAPVNKNTISKSSVENKNSTQSNSKLKIGKSKSNSNKVVDKVAVLDQKNEITTPKVIASNKKRTSINTEINNSEESKIETIRISQPQLTKLNSAEFNFNVFPENNFAFDPFKYRDTSRKKNKYNFEIPIWQIAAMVSPTTTFNNYFIKPSNNKFVHKDLLDKYDGSIKNKTTLNYGISAKYNFSKFSVSSGIEYFSTGQVGNYDLYVNNAPIFDIDGSIAGYYYLDDEFAEHTTGSANTTITYIQVPVLAAYVFPLSRRLAISTQAGGSFLFNTGSKGDILTAGRLQKESLNDKSQQRKTNNNLIGGIGIQYQFSRKMSFSFDTRYSSMLKPQLSNSMRYNNHIRTIGFNFGLIFNLSH
ncbi:MAG: outer membrane beta-barrel protein [Bacteroidia bacterium]|nr:outer membrane beta-barrel protein [Bacteroidia bacterium]